MPTEDRLETAWQASRAGLIDWASVQRVQAGMMPRCANHPDRPMVTYQGSAPLCADCYVAWIRAHREEQGSDVR